MKQRSQDSNRPASSAAELVDTVVSAGTEARQLRVSLARTYLLCEQIEQDMRNIRLALQRSYSGSRALPEGMDTDADAAVIKLLK